MTPRADEAREVVVDLRERQYRRGLEIGCSRRVVEALAANDEEALGELQQGCSPPAGSDVAVVAG